MGMYSTVQEPTRNEIVAVGTTAVEVARARQTELMPRKTIVIRNNSAAATSIITINLGLSVAVANAGIVLRQYESFSDSTESGYQAFQGTITAICADANGSLSIFER